MKTASNLDGIINFHKPAGLTSAHALHRVRGITRQRKSGHTGTLDREAEGVLVLCMGRATKLVERVMDLPKVYRTVARLDATSSGFDSEGELTPVDVAAPPDLASVRAALASFEGRIEQVPPAFSALKVRGQPAYKLSRAGKPPELEARTVEIYWIHLWRYEWPVIDFEVTCGRGTYIRALIRDLGAVLGVGGYLTTLVRDAVGPFTLANSWTLERLETAHGTGAYLLPLDQARALLEEGPKRIPPRPTDNQDASAPAADSHDDTPNQPA